MKFECNCKNQRQWVQSLDCIHNEKVSLANFEVMARLWYTENNTTIMVEHQVATKYCKDLTGEDEPDWLTAYLVDDENDDDCSEEIFTETIEDNISYHQIKIAMIEFAREVINKFYK